MAIRVLLIDGSRFDRELTERALRGIASPPGPVEVDWARDWSEGRTRLAEGRYDLLLLDFGLPESDGLGVLQTLEGVHHPPVIMLTGQEDVRTAVETLRRGAGEYVAKTRDWGEPLRLAVGRVLARAELERELAESRAQLAAYAVELEQRVAARTAMVQAQAAHIEALYLRAEETARLKSEIVANVSHEFRTPLNVILGYTHLLEEGFAGENTACALDMLRKVRTGAERLHRLLESLLSLGQLKAGRMGASTARFAVGTLIEQIRADAEALNVDKGLSIEWKVPPPITEVESDPEKVRAIAYHLMSNAIKFTDAGTIEVALEPRAQGGLVLTVSDTGIGLPSEAQAVIFEDFRQLDGSDTRRYEGLGLGLGIVKRYTTLLGGTIHLRSAPGAGTSIAVELPAGIESRIGASPAPA